MSLKDAVGFLQIQSQLQTSFKNIFMLPPPAPYSIQPTVFERTAY